MINLHFRRYIRLYFSISVNALFLVASYAHLIQIDHNDFRPNLFPRQHISPVLLHTKQLSPSEYMVDLTNELAFRILHYHSILNRNNFAFSPTALMSVLIATYEGSAGRSRSEIKNVLHLPKNHDIIRIGYRDIHRRLRTYFFDSDNPLKGLSLNKENVTITKDYETILMFYGYDLAADMVAATAIPNSTTVDATLHATTTSSASLSNSTDDATSNTTKVDTSTIRMSTVFSTQISNSSDSITETPATTRETNTVKTEQNITSTASEEKNENVNTKEPKESAIEAPSFKENSTETPSLKENSTGPEITEFSTKPEAEMIEAAELISSFVAEENSEQFARIQKARVTRLPSARLQVPLKTKIKPPIHYLPPNKTSSRLRSRTKRHLFGLNDFDSNVFLVINSEAPVQSPLTTGATNSELPAFVELSKNYDIHAVDQQFIVTPAKATTLKQNYNTDVISHVFYSYNKHIIYTAFKVYNAVLYYKYFDRLRMSVLELELDTSKYNLLIVLPDYNTDLTSAAASLQDGPNLRLMRKQLKPKWVQAIIPDFKLHGTMFLTNDLQNLGINDVFEPNNADLRPMTDEKNIYIKHIEQSINVHIRTNPINQLRRYNDAQTQPVQISVNHPFLFFIVDRDLDVAVMAGRILNPLNVRIQ